MKNSDTRSSPATFPVLMYWRFPRKSAHAIVCSSELWTKPGGPAPELDVRPPAARHAGDVEAVAFADELALEPGERITRLGGGGHVVRPLEPRQGGPAAEPRLRFADVVGLRDRRIAVAHRTPIR
jgi:hypothetical protein